jgi:hypothetical protein
VRLDVAPKTATEVDLRFTQGPAVTFSVALSVADRDAVASGTPGDITYRLRTGRFDLGLDDLRIAGETDTPPVEAQFDLSLASVDLSTRVTEGEMVGITSQVSYGPMIYSYAVRSGGGAGQRGAGRAEASQGTSATVMPRGGPDLLNLGDALRAGMAIAIEASAGASLSQTVTSNAHMVTSQDTQTSLGGTQRLRFDASGLTIAGTLKGAGFSTADMTGFVEVAGQFGEVAWDWAMPVLASDTRQPFRLGLTLRDLTLDDRVWARIDPGAALPREALTFDLLAGGEVTLPFGLVDQAGWERIAASQEMPFELNSAALERLEVKGLGLSGQASAAFTFDNGDLLTFDGLPRPEGMASGTVEGAQALLDRLVAAGLLAPEDAFGARMALAFAFKAAGPDRAGSVLEVTPEGSVLLNGQRVR